MSEREYQVYGVGNGIMDVLVSVSDQEFEQLGFERGSYGMLEVDEQLRLLDQFSSHEPSLVSGGSAANTMVALAQLGGRGAYTCCLGDDHYGHIYRNQFTSLGLTLDTPIQADGATGTCLSIITPDAERTMRTSLGVSQALAPEHIEEEKIKNAEWVFLEGYPLANPGTGPDAINTAVEMAKSHGTKIAITVSASFVIEHHRELVESVVANSDIFFANEEEARCLTGHDSTQSSFEYLTEQVPHVVVTKGAEGVLLQVNGERAELSAFECTPVDLTGAGDLLCGAFLYGLANGYSAADSARASCYLASKVIVQVGARLHEGVVEAWQEAIT